MVFGGEFEHKINPPTGAWIAVKFANYIDPALQTDLYADKPWLYSPMLCSMNAVNVEKLALGEPPAKVVPGKSSQLPKSARASVDELSAPASAVQSTPSADEILGKWRWGGETELQEDNRLLFESTEVPFDSSNIAERRKYFQKQKNRQAESFKPDRVYHLEVLA